MSLCHHLIIPPSQPFWPSCAEALSEHFTADEMQRCILILPNKRSATALREALATRAPHQACMLPEMLILGQLDRLQLMKIGAAHADFFSALLATAPAMTTDDYHCLLAQHVQAAGEHFPALSSMVRARAVAADLAALHHMLVSHDVSVSDYVRESLATQRSDQGQILRKLLAILQYHWPEICVQMAKISPAEHQHALMKALNNHLPTLAAHYHFCVLGSTGSIPSTRALIARVAGLDSGLICLPGAGFSPPLPEAVWHVHATLTACDMASTQMQVSAPVQADQYTLATSEEEARATVLLIKETLRQPDQTCMLVTPDVTLIRHVDAALRAQGVIASTIALNHLANLPAMRGLLAVFRLIIDGDDSLAARILMDALTVADARHVHAWENLVLWLDKTTLRRPYLRAIQPPPEADDGTRLLLEKYKALGAAFSALDLTPRSVEQWAHVVQNLIAASDVFALSALPEQVQNTFQAYQHLGQISARQMLECLESIALETLSEGGSSTHPRVKLLTPVEARLQHTDHLILGSFHDGFWPILLEQTLWLGGRLSAALKLPTSHDDAALSAHDVWLLSSMAKKTSVTRARIDQGKYTNPSPLAALLTLSERPELQAFLSTNAEQHIAPDEPGACPDVALRPRALKVTALDTMLSDPYALYAEYVLKLKPLDDYGTSASVRELGTLAHKLMAELLSGKLATKADSVEFLNAQMAQFRLSLIEKQFWLSRLGRVADYGLTLRAELLASGATITPEHPLETTLRFGNGEEVTLSGRIDLLTHHGGERLTITDFKTGGMISKADMEKGRNAQHLGYSLLLEEEGLSPSAWQCIKLPLASGDMESSSYVLSKEDYDARKAAILSTIHTLLFTKTPFYTRDEEASSRHQSPYDGVSRRLEWS